ncbi:MAG: NAD(P)-dependent oxidoreductase [Planctomycetota bacterium]|nr:NAD(P)-dependent oxidoreductase [Planctomycetota bacterium]
MRAVITGGTGFVAGHLVQHLLEKGDEILLINRSTTSPQNPPALLWDIRSAPGASVVAQVQEFDPDVIFHLAAISVRALCGETQPSSDAQAVNVQGTSHVIELCTKLRQPPLLIFTSSVYVYGSRRSRSEQVSEITTPIPDNGYGKSKLAAEALLQQTSGAVPWVIARSFQHSGPGQAGSLLIPEWIHKLRNCDTTLNVRNLDSWIDICDARDVVRAYRMLADPRYAREIFNVGSGRATRSGDILSTLQTLLGVHCPIEESQPGTHYLPIADVSRIQDRVGWQTTISIEQMLKDCIASSPPAVEN